MSLLRIHLPSAWPDADPATPLPWCRLGGARGELTDAGNAALAELPPADTYELVIPAELVLLTRARLPRGSKQKMRQLLPFAIEDRLVAEPDTVHVAAGSTLADGQTALAVIDKAWLAQSLARLSEAGLRPRSAWPETLLAALPADGWTMVWDGRSGFLRSGTQTGMSLDGGSSAQPPAALLLSVAEARAAGALPQRLLLRLR
jgi:general secretion pathway protein L